MKNPIMPIIGPRPGRIAIFFASTGRGSFMGRKAGIKFRIQPEGNH